MSDVVLLVYGDSLSLPRAQGAIGAIDTYPEVLREKFAAQTGVRAAVLNRSRAGTAISTMCGDFVSDSVYFGAGGRHVLIIQCGIVDCAPRPIPPELKQRISRLPTVLRWAIARFLHHARPALLRSGRSWRNTGQAAFAQVLDDWLAKAQRIVDSIYVVNIAPTSPAIERHSPGLTASIDEYNAIIARVVASPRTVPVRLVDVHRAILDARDGIDRCIDADGHHITIAGHRLYAELIAEDALQHSPSQVIT